MASAAPAWFAIIDGAQDPRLAGLVKSAAEHASLFKGDIDPDVLIASPWLVRLAEGEQVLPTWQAHGRGLNWGIMILSSLPFEQLRRHCRRFLQAKLPDGMLAMFRFYDPRVFRTYMAAATPEERQPWFAEGVLRYAVEREDGRGLHEFQLVEGRLCDGDRQIG